MKNINGNYGFIKRKISTDIMVLLRAGKLILHLYIIKSVDTQILKLIF